MTSDDTEHTAMAAQSLLASGGEPRRFARSFAWRLRWWFLALPAGVGMATAKACLKLWIGFPPGRSGVWSAGNGPAMRAAVLGVYACDNLPLLRELVAASSRITHTDPAAEHGALAIALAAAFAAGRNGPSDGVDAPADAAVNVAVSAEAYLRFVTPHLAGTEMLRLIEDVGRKLLAGASLEQYLESRKLGRGVSGYVNHTVPACLFSWLQNPTDFRTAVDQIVIAGGDADSTGAIVGALAGVSGGRASIPAEWVANLAEWPRTVAWMERLADRLAADRVSAVKSRRPLPLFWPGVLLRNLLFLVVVLAHGVRRLFPPY